MSAFILMAILAVPAGDGDGSELQEPRRFHEIGNDVRMLIRRDARADDLQQRAPVIREMCAVYIELKRDSRLATSDTLKGYKAKLWSRLTKIKGELQRELARQKPKSEEEANSPGELADQASESFAAQLSLVGHTLGGPGYVFSRRGAAGGGGANDNGQSLVDLIQRTIAPDFWDVNGGPGVIVYYAPLRVLVVRATSEIHGNVGGLLNKGLR